MATSALHRRPACDHALREPFADGTTRGQVVAHISFTVHSYSTRKPGARTLFLFAGMHILLTSSFYTGFLLTQLMTVRRPTKLDTFEEVITVSLDCCKQIRAINS